MSADIELDESALDSEAADLMRTTNGLLTVTVAPSSGSVDNGDTTAIISVVLTTVTFESATCSVPAVMERVVEHPFGSPGNMKPEPVIVTGVPTPAKNAAGAMDEIVAVGGLVHCAWQTAVKGPDKSRRQEDIRHAAERCRSTVLHMPPALRPSLEIILHLSMGPIQLRRKAYRI